MGEDRIGATDRLELLLYGATLVSIPLSNTATWIFVVFIFILTLYRLIIGDAQYRRTPLDIAFLSLLALTFLSVVYSVSPEHTLRSFKKLIFFLLYLPTVICFSKWLGRREILRKIFSLLIVSGVITGLYASIRFVALAEARGKGFFGGPTTLGMLMAILIVTTLSLGEENVVFLKRRLPRRLFWWLALLILLCGLVVSSGRAAIGATVLGILFYAIFKRKWSGLVLLAAAALFIILMPSVGERMATVAHPLEHTSGRDSIYLGASRVLWERPVLGFGFNTFKVVYPLPNPRDFGNWHNLYLQYYLDLGLVGLAFLLYLIYRVFRVGAQTLKSPVLKGFQKDICFCILLSSVVLYLMGLFSFSTYDLPMLVLHSLYLGILSNYGRTAGAGGW